jgi:carboxypeptidase Q
MKVVAGGGGVDIGPMMKEGVPGMSIETADNGKYFWYHHSNSDTVDKINPQDFNQTIAAVALAIYIYSDLNIDLPSNLK